MKPYSHKAIYQLQCDDGIFSCPLEIATKLSHLRSSDDITRILLRIKQPTQQSPRSKNNISQPSSLNPIWLLPSPLYFTSKLGEQLNNHMTNAKQ